MLNDAIWAAHFPHHMRVDGLYLGKQIRRDLSPNQVNRVIEGCDVCQLIYPSKRAEKLLGHGELGFEMHWFCDAINVIHYITIHIFNG